MSGQRTAQISRRKDARNRAIISNISYGPVGRMLKQDIEWLLAEGTPEQRAAFAKKIRIWMLFGVAFLAVFLINGNWQHVFGPKPQPTLPVDIDAGIVQSVQLHETALSRSTTIVTTIGTYQVVGGVSAEPGVYAVLRRETTMSGNEISSVCINSKIKQACYRLL
jgi:hypothetical protein